MTSSASKFVRLLKIVVVAAIIITLVRRFRGQSTPDATGQARWQPLVEPTPPPKRSQPVKFAEPADAESADAEPEPGTQSWVEPDKGECPASHPIKGNADSGIFHVPGGQSYERTVPERCYATAEDAEADGFRQAKR